MRTPKKEGSELALESAFSSFSTYYDDCCSRYGNCDYTAILTPIMVMV
jgi:hypothetical protein